jgi:hypothetical protein
VGHGERRRELERQFPGWEIWYVPREPDRVTWCARPQLLIGAGSPEDLAAAIRSAHGPVIPDSLLLASPAGLHGEGEAAPRAGGAGRCCPQAREGPEKAAGSPPPQGVRPGVARRSGERPTAPPGAAAELGPGGLGPYPGVGGTGHRG